MFNFFRKKPTTKDKIFSGIRVSFNKDSDSLFDNLGCDKSREKFVIEFIENVAKKHDSLSSMAQHIINTEALNDNEKLLALLKVNGLVKMLYHKTIISDILKNL